MDVGEILQQIDENKYVIRTSQGTKYLVNKRKCIKQEQLKIGTRIATNANSLSIMHVLPPQVDSQVFSFITPSNNQQEIQIGGLNEVLMEIQQHAILPLTNPEIFKRIGISMNPTVLLLGPPGVGKTLLCSKLAQMQDCTFIKLVGSQIVQKYIGESARLMKEIFAFARRQPRCIILIDEIDSICLKRQAGSSGSDKEVNRAMMTLLVELDGVKSVDKVKQPACIFTTNRPKLLDEAFLRRIGATIEIGLPDYQQRKEILEIYQKGVKFEGQISWNKIIQQCDGFNGADLRNLITEAGLQAIRDNRKSIQNKDLMEGIRIIKKGKTVEQKAWE